MIRPYLAILFAFCFFSDSFLFAEDIAVFRGNAERTGEFVSTGIIKPVKVKWQFRANDRIDASPVAYKDTVYVGSYDGNLYALDKNTGKIKWQFSTGNCIRTSVAASQDKIFFESRDGHCYAVDAKTGEELWKYFIGDWIIASRRC